MGNRCENSGNSVRLYFLGLQNHRRWWLWPWNYELGDTYVSQSSFENHLQYHWLPRWQSDKESACQCRRLKRQGSVPELRRSPEGGNGNIIQYCCLVNSMNRGAWGPLVLGVTKSGMWEWLSYTMLQINCTSVKLRKNKSIFLKNLSREKSNWL